MTSSTMTTTPTMTTVMATETTTDDAALIEEGPEWVRPGLPQLYDTVPIGRRIERRVRRAVEPKRLV